MRNALRRAGHDAGRVSARPDDPGLRRVRVRGGDPVHRGRVGLRQADRPRCSLPHRPPLPSRARSHQPTVSLRPIGFRTWPDILGQRGGDDQLVAIVLPGEVSTLEHRDAHQFEVPGCDEQAAGQGARQYCLAARLARTCFPKCSPPAVSGIRWQRPRPRERSRAIAARRRSSHAATVRPASSVGAVGSSPFRISLGADAVKLSRESNSKPGSTAARFQLLRSNRPPASSRTSDRAISVVTRDSRNLLKRRVLESAARLVTGPIPGGRAAE